MSRSADARRLVEHARRACTLALQVVFTRLLSAVMAYHFSFLAISLALLGTGAGALIVYLMPHRFSGPLEPLLARERPALTSGRWNPLRRVMAFDLKPLSAVFSTFADQRLEGSQHVRR